jgi:glyoxylase-like metal-dependent hydrolase (beta-lactamase superfamily II)
MRSLLAAAAVTILAVLPTTAFAQVATPRNTEVYHFAVGQVRAAVISDGSYESPPQPLYAPDAPTRDVENALARRFRSSSAIPVYFNVLYLDFGDRQVLIDAGAGASLGPALGRTPANLRAAGIDPATIDDILISHAHLDHVGGLFTATGGKVYPNATLHVSETELTFWRNPDLSGMAAPEAFLENFRATARNAFAAYADSTRTFRAGDEVIPGVTAIATPGHTPGHTAFRIVSGDVSLTHVGDLFFDEAFDLEHPTWRTAFDADGTEAGRTRTAFLRQATRNREFLFAFHMPFPALGHVTRAQRGFAWEPIMWRFE